MLTLRVKNSDSACNSNKVNSINKSYGATSSVDSAANPINPLEQVPPRRRGPTGLRGPPARSPAARGARNPGSGAAAVPWERSVAKGTSARRRTARAPEIAVSDRDIIFSCMYTFNIVNWTVST